MRHNTPAARFTATHRLPAAPATTPSRSVAADVLRGYSKGVSLTDRTPTDGASADRYTIAHVAPARRTTPPSAKTMPFRKTKIVCTIGPATWDRETLFALADAGMNVARLNMSHGDHASHKKVVDLVNEYNALGRGTVALLLDTKGPEVRSGDLPEPLMMKTGDTYFFTIAAGADGKGGRIGVNYDGFIDDVAVGDVVLVDGGLLSLKVQSIKGKEVQVEVVDGGKFGSRRHLNIRGKSANLPAITDRDWADLKFGVEVCWSVVDNLLTSAHRHIGTLAHVQVGVDYYALSFVRDADVIYEVKDWLAQQGAPLASSLLPQDVQALLPHITQARASVCLPRSKAQTACKTWKPSWTPSTGPWWRAVTWAPSCPWRRCPTGSRASCRGAASGASPSSWRPTCSSR